VQTVNGFNSVPVSMLIALNGAPQTIWFRVVARNAAGAAAGEILSFTTVPPVIPVAPAVVTDSASGVSPHSATLHGTVTPGTAATMAWFEWSTDSGFASITSTAPQPVGTGSAPIRFADVITGLMIEVPVWVRAVASSAQGTVHGAVLRIR
jgi:hypothetical protein